MKLEIYEHRREVLIELVNDGITENLVDFDIYSKAVPRTFINKRNKEIPYYRIHCLANKVEVEADYYVGIDWIVEGKKFVYVAPKINAKLIQKFITETEEETDIGETESEAGLQVDVNERCTEVNYLKMFLELAQHPTVSSCTDGLLCIDWDAQQIPIKQREDILTPFLIVQFLNLLKQIVQKGLKKSYYTTTQNLEGRIKGKILVGQNVKTNVVKNRLTRTFCEYQEFGIDHVENRFLKKVLRFLSNYIANNAMLFKGSDETLQQIIGYCNPAFEHVSEIMHTHELRHVKENVFFKEYKEASRIGQYILKRFAHNISNASKEQVFTPPFWIDMPRLFELYVYKHLLEVFPGHVKYHLTTYGNELDFLITQPGSEMVVDAKYKLHYSKGHIHQDIRQVAGYARLKKVYDTLGKENNELINCMIVYPDLEGHDSIIELTKDMEIKAYQNVYKLGIKIPGMSPSSVLPQGRKI